MLKLSNMKLPQKFMILGMVALTAVAFPAWLYFSEINAELDVAKGAAAGVAPIVALQRVVQLTQEHRGLSAGMLSGNTSLANRIPAKQAELSSALEALQSSLKDSSISSQTISHINSTQQRLNTLFQAVVGSQLKAAESTVQHTHVIDEFLLGSDHILDDSGLSLDPEVTTYSLIQATMADAPKLAENMGQMRAKGTGYLAQGELSAEGRANLVGMNKRVTEYFRDTTRNLAKATSSDTSMKAALEVKASEVKASIDRVLLMTDQSLINAQTLKLPANQFFEEYTNTINGIYAFNTTAIENLSGMLTKRVNDMQQSLYMMFGLILATVIAAFLLSVVFIRSITVPMREAVKIANEVASGKFKQAIDDKSTNETGLLLQSLNKMSKNLQEEKQQVAELQAETDAVGKSRTMIYLKLDGTIVSANEKFLNETGHKQEDVIGKHISMFKDSNDKSNADFNALWSDLVNGKFFVGQYKVVCKNGEEKWYQINYNPILDASGKAYRVVSYGTDITEIKLQNADVSAQISAVNEVQAVIEFNMDGTIITANDNFKQAMGYSLDEIKGKHHRMFVEAEYGKSTEYKEFWEQLGQGNHNSGNYKRFTRSGAEIWIQASYFPIKDLNGKPWKVVKFASDITSHIKASQMLEEAVEQTLQVVSQAKDGDLSQRIPLEGKTGSIETLCSGINELIKNTSASLTDVAHVLEALAKGDLTHKITSDYQGVFGQLKDNTNITVDKLTEIVSNIRSGTGSIDTASKEIAAGNNDLSQRTEEQSSSLEETASSMEELTATVRQNSENANQANQLAIGASEVAVKGGDVVSQVVTTMSEINDSSKKIVDIIGVIDGIAFQTNILALNAAVEAARAGEQGRGFAVVATEVRTLAQRSAAAAKEIKGLIDDSVSKVDEGNELVDQAGKTMDDIVQSIKRVTDIMSEISAASLEQSEGIEQVNQAVTSMDEVTQQNAALVEEAAAASESMIEQSGSLVETVSVFQLKPGEIARGHVSSDVQERRGPNRAENVERLPKAAAQDTPVNSKPARTGTNEEWEEF